MNNDDLETFKRLSREFGKKGAEKRWGITNNPPCPYCNSLNVVKNSQRFRCKDCNKYFSENNKKETLTERAKKLGISRQTLWAREKKNKNISENP